MLYSASEIYFNVTVSCADFPANLWSLAKATDVSIDIKNQCKYICICIQMLKVLHMYIVVIINNYQVKETGLEILITLGDLSNTINWVKTQGLLVLVTTSSVCSLISLKVPWKNHSIRIFPTYFSYRYQLYYCMLKLCKTFVMPQKL